MNSNRRLYAILLKQKKMRLSIKKSHFCFVLNWVLAKINKFSEKWTFFLFYIKTIFIAVINKYKGGIYYGTI